MRGKTSGAIRTVSLWTRIKKQKVLHLIMVPTALWFVAMYYVPMLGNIIAFQDYSIRKGFLASTWVGFEHFISFFSNPFTVNLIRNTLAMSSMALVFGTLAAVIFALLLNEVGSQPLKRVVQSISYLPYFVSMAVVANLFLSILSRTGALNELLVSVGLVKEAFPFLERPKLYWIILTIQHIWKNVGWNAIIYLAAISAIPAELYEAAYVDGAGRFRRLFHITFPGIIPTIAVLLIMNSGNLLRGGFEQQLFMFNPIVLDVGEVINTYVYKRGIGSALYSFATAVGLFQSIVSVVLVVLVNRVTKKIAGFGLW